MTRIDEYEAAAKAWRERNSNFQNSWNDTGLSDEPTHAPPSIDEQEYAADTTAFAGLIFATGRITPDETGEQAHAMRQVHVYDPTLVDPDA
jgi:hypothetical protein